MFNLLKKKTTKQPKKQVAQFVKQCDLTADGELITYSTRLNGLHVPHSLSCDYTKARAFFDGFVYNHFNQTTTIVMAEYEFPPNPSGYVS